MSSVQRLSVKDVDPAAHEAMHGLERYVRAGAVGPRLLELVKIRASQLHGCAFCLDMHTRNARAAGEAQRRLDVRSRSARGMAKQDECAAAASSSGLVVPSGRPVRVA